jgi:hypothetical protein
LLIGVVAAFVECQIREDFFAHVHSQRIHSLMEADVRHVRHVRQECGENRNYFDGLGLCHSSKARWTTSAPHRPLATSLPSRWSAGTQCAYRAFQCACPRSWMLMCESWKGRVRRTCERCDFAVCFFFLWWLGSLEGRWRVLTSQREQFGLEKRVKVGSFGTMVIW